MTDSEGRRRYIAKPYASGKRWHVYDRVRGSWPVEIPGFGRVEEDFASEAEAQVEADRVEFR